jgi:DNA mismatch endonuclease (patch repair protein)
MDTLTTQERSERMGRVLSRDTRPELSLRSMVWALGYRYRKHRKDIPGHPDIAFVGKKRAIFLHGCFWHRHDCPSGGRSPKTRTEFWTAKFKRNVERDAEVTKQLKNAGWQSLVVWECQLRDRSRVERRIRKFLDA